MKSQCGLSEETTLFIANHLNILLSDMYVYKTKLLKFHWTVKGSNFGPLHKLFEQGYQLTLPIIDDTAERIMQINHTTYGTLHEFLKFTRLQEDVSQKKYTAEEMIKQLVDDTQSIILFIRELINHTDSTYRDMGTNNFLCDTIQTLEKYNWFLISHLQ
jgi:starvation-inducible DNA-binding protein